MKKRNRINTSLIIFLDAILIVIFIFFSTNEIRNIISEKEQEVLSYQKELIELLKSSLKENVEIAHSILSDFYYDYKKGKYSEEEAKKMAKDKIRNIRYNNNGYFWIDNINFINQVLPADPSVEGTNRKDLTDPMGNKIIVNFINGAVKYGDYYQKYYYRKLNDPKDYLKIGYVKMFKEWDWVIGTGFYLDDLMPQINYKKSILENEKNDKIIVFVINVVLTIIIILSFSFFLINSILRKSVLNPIEKIIQSINNEDDLPLAELKNAENEFGPIAVILEKYMKQKKELEIEIETRKELELKLIEDQLRYKQIFDNNQAIKYIIDSETLKFFEVNTAALKFYGYTNDEFMNMKITDINMASEESIRELIKDLEIGRRNSFEVKHKLADGTIKDVQIFTGILILNEHEYLYSIIFDITDKKIIEDKLREDEKKLRELNSSKDKFFSIIAHDLKSPLASTLMILRMIYDDKVDLTWEEKDRMLLNVKKSTEKTMDLLEELLEWARLQKGSMQIKFKEINIKEIVSKNVELLKETAGNKKINLVMDSHEDIMVYSDEYMITTVIRNIISNSIKFTKQKGTIKAGYINRGKFVEVYIEDDGIGMPDKIKEKLFKIEESVKVLGTSGERGTGLGLILCKEFIEKNGGNIWFESEEGKGTTFYFTVQVKK